MEEEAKILTTHEDLKNEALRLVSKKLEMVRWLGECPAYDAQAYYETANHLLFLLDEEALVCLRELGEDLLHDRLLESREADDEEKALAELVRDIEAL